MAYTYKGTDIANIIDTGGITQSGFDGFPGARSKNSAPNSRIPDLGYRRNNVDIANDLNARHHKYNTSVSNVTIPANAKHVRYILQGGGGGGGGGGGAANSGMPNSNQMGTAYATGGWGGYGGAGQRIKTTSDFPISSSFNSFKIDIGAGGTGGQGGNSTRTQKNNRVYGQSGKTGFDGGDTVLRFNSTVIASAHGGNHGNGGGGATAEWWPVKDDEFPGDNGDTDSRTEFTGKAHDLDAANDWDTEYATNDRPGGNRGNYGKHPSGGGQGPAGEPGYAVVVWLYK